jgi:hypothetical protein
MSCSICVAIDPSPAPVSGIEQVLRRWLEGKKIAGRAIDLASFHPPGYPGGDSGGVP